MIAVGLDPTTRLGSALTQRGVTHGAPSAGAGVVVGAGAADPAAAIEEALAAGASVLVETPGRLTRDELERFAADDRVRSGLDYRHDPSLRRAVAAVRGGAIGLAWAANGEAVWPAGDDADTTIANLLDALVSLVALRPVGGVRLAAGSVAVAVTFEHGVVGTVTCVPRSDGTDPDAAYARLLVTGSHGSLDVLLDGPRLVRAGTRRGPLRLERSGADLLLDAFERGSAPALRETVDVLDVVAPATSEVPG
jgi:hypothetical protein